MLFILSLLSNSEVMIFAEISFYLTVAWLGHSSAALCSSHVFRNDHDLIQNIEIS